MIGGNFRIAIEKLPTYAENIDAREQDQTEANAEENPQRENGILMRMDDRQHDPTTC